MRSVAQRTGIILSSYQFTRKMIKRNALHEYQGTSLISVPGKVYTKVLQQRLQKYVEGTLTEEQAGFRAVRGTVDQLLVIRQLSEKFFEKNRIL